MATLPYDFKTNHFADAPEGTAFSISGQPPGNIAINPVTGVVSAGIATSDGTFSATVSATYNGVTRTMGATFNVAVAGAIPSSAFAAFGDLSVAGNRTLVSGDVSELINKVSGGTNATQTNAAQRPTLDTVAGASVMTTGNGENLDYTLPASVITADAFYFTTRIIMTAANTKSISGLLIAGGDGEGVGFATNGNGAAFTLRAGGPSARVNGADQGSGLTRDEFHDLIYPDGSSGNVISTVTIGPITPSADADWSNGIHLLGYPGTASFSLPHHSLSQMLYTDSGQIAQAESWVEAESQGV